MVITKARSMAVLIVAAATVGIIAFACQSCATPQPEMRVVAFGNAADLAAGPIDPAKFQAGLPAAFLVCGADDIESAMKERARLRTAHGDVRFTTIVDVSKKGELERTALGDKWLEAALDDGYPIVFDENGSTARSLRDGQKSTMLVFVNAELRVPAATTLPGDAVSERAALGIAEK